MNVELDGDISRTPAVRPGASDDLRDQFIMGRIDWYPILLRACGHLCTYDSYFKRCCQCEGRKYAFPYKCPIV